MPERAEYAPGTPSWVDIGTDVEAAKQFYGGLFGWGGRDAGPAEETGGYGFFVKGEKLVAGYGPQQSPGPPNWTTYVSVDDADDITKKVEAAGGTVVVAPMQVMTAGRMAVFQDAQGAFISAWEPGGHKGAEVVNESGAMSWNELNTRDVEGSKAFYREVFGWEPGPDGTEVATVRRWARRDWGEEGDTMAWCCTEGTSAYVGDRPVLDSLGDELEAVVGTAVYVELRRRLGTDRS